MTNHQLTLGPDCFRNVDERRLRFVTMKRPLSGAVKAGEMATLSETSPDGKKLTGWCIECLITNVATSLTMPGFLDRDYIALSLEVTEVYKTTPSAV